MGDPLIIINIYKFKMNYMIYKLKKKVQKVQKFASMAMTVQNTNTPHVCVWHPVAIDTT
jgi:hypothetical protein